MSSVDDPETADKQPPAHSPTWKRCFKDFLEYTTAHGCSRLAASKGIVWKIFWITVVLTAHISFWYHTVVIVQEYLQKPTRSKVTMQQNKVLDFPVITLCNRNMLRQSKLTEKIRKEVQDALNTTLEKQTNHSKKHAPDTADSDVLNFMYQRGGMMRQIVSQERPEVLREMGHQFKDMILDCMFDGEDCTRGPNNDGVWRHLWIENVGNCYMFNRVLPGDSVKPHQTMLSGDQHGLSLLINIEQYEYLEGFSPYAGINAVIGAQGEMPFPLNSGINVGPGLSTSIEIAMKQSTRLDPFNNGSCESTGQLDPYNIYHQYNMTYSKLACRVSCLSKLQERHCNCSQFHFTNSHVGYCVTEDKKTGDCIDRVGKIFLKGGCEKPCPPSCADTEYSKMISSYKWPAVMFKSAIKESMDQLVDLSLKTHEDIRDNLLELHIYYGDMDNKLVEETLKYEFEDLISSIGGQMGMWIGLSALTIAELVELTWIIAVAVSRKNKPFNSAPNVK